MGQQPERFTIVRTAVSPNGPGGVDGPPIEDGVATVARIRPEGPPIERYFDPPRADLLDMDFDAMTDEEIAAL